jgi:3-oxoacyl-[acyl-carrier-protein] synthase II
MAGLSPIGTEWKTVRDALKSGQSGVRRIDDWDEVEGLETRLGAPVSDFVVPADYPRKKTRAMGRVSLMSTRATELALLDAGLLGDPVIRSGDTGVSHGSSSGSPTALGVYARQLFAKQTTRGIGANDFLQLMSHTTSANIANFFGIRGRIIPTSSACTSGSQGIGYGYESIRYGKQEVMLTGGAEELERMPAAIFDVIFATSTRNEDPHGTPRPFDVDRDGTVVGEGAGCLVLEELERALGRGAHIYAEIVGYGTGCDGRHMTNPDAEGMEHAIRLGLTDAGIDAGAVGYVNAHGTGTEAGDIAESQATHRIFGDQTPVSTLKGHLGHTLGACGVLEAWMTIEMMNEGWVAPTLNLNEVDERCEGLDYVRDAPRELDFEIAMSNNFAFGGVNTSLVFKRWSS